MMLQERFTIGHRVRSATTGGMAPKESWAAPVDVKVYGYAPPSSDDVTRAEQTGVKHDLDVYCRAPFTKHHDKLVINGAEWLVQGDPDDFRFGPFAWAAGVRIRLSRAEG